jgi:hypothetical protein
MSIHSTQKASIEKTAGRRLKRLANGQRSIGRMFIGQTPGRLNPGTQRRESSTFTDFLTPAAQAAREAFMLGHPETGLGHSHT